MAGKSRAARPESLAGFVPRKWRRVGGIDREAALSTLSPAKRLLLEKMRNGMGAKAGEETPSIPPRRSGTLPPLSPEQAQLWHHASLAGDLPIYNEPITIRRRGPCDPALIEESFNTILRRHEIWRTSFRRVDGVVRQAVQAELRIRLPRVDL